MKELLASARNHFMSLPDEGDPSHMTEVILILTEPRFACDAAGVLNRTRDVETLRFCASVKSLRSLAERLTAWADEADIGNAVAAEAIENVKGKEAPTEVT